MPNTTPTGYICHSLVIDFIHLPKMRYIKPRFSSCFSSSASSNSPWRILLNTVMIPARMTTLRMAMR